MGVPQDRSLQDLGDPMTNTRFLGWGQHLAAAKHILPSGKLT